MVDSSRRRALRAGGVLAAASLAGCASVPSLESLTGREQTGGERGGDGVSESGTDSTRGWAAGPHDLPLSVRATGDEQRLFRVVVRTDDPAVGSSAGGLATAATVSVPADAARTVEDAFPVPEDGRVVYSALLQEDGVVVGSRTVEVPDHHTAHAVEAAVFEDSVDWELRVH